MKAERGEFRLESQKEKQQDREDFGGGDGKTKRGKTMRLRRQERRWR